MKRKNILRKNILHSREGLSKEYCLEASVLIEKSVETILESTLGKDKTNIIGLYYPIKGEPDLLNLINKLDYNIAIPKLWGTKLEFIKYNKSAGFEQSEFGELMQPKNNDIVQPNIVVFPGIAFSIVGDRLGFGSGHYDRYFGRVDPEQDIKKIGVCFHENLYETLPRESHDIQSNYIVTNKIIISL